MHSSGKAVPKIFKMIQIRFKPSCKHCLLLALPLPQTPFASPPSGMRGYDFLKVISLNGILRKLLSGIYINSAHGKGQMRLPVSQGKDKASTLLGTGTSWCARRISTVPFRKISGYPIFLGQDVAGKLQFVFLIELVSAYFSFSVLDFK